MPEPPETFQEGSPTLVHPSGETKGEYITYQEQMDRWVKGESVHGAGEEGACCPDFSCCFPENAASMQERLLFKRAYDEGDNKTVNAMLMGFLGSAMSKYKPKTKVYIAGEPIEEA